MEANLTLVLRDIRRIETCPHEDVSLSEVTGALPHHLSRVPDWLRIDCETMVKEIETIIYTEEGQYNDNFTFLIRLRSGIYLYADYIDGSGHYSCCASLKVTFSHSWDLIKSHIIFREIEGLKKAM